VHRQRLPGAAGHQAVVRVGQAAVAVEGHDLARGQDGGQPRLLGDDKAPAQHIARQPHRGHRAQHLLLVGALQRQQRHRVTAEVGFQRAHHALQPQRGRQVHRQVVQQHVEHGSSYPIGSN
jgi:hypothetical protein